MTHYTIRELTETDNLLFRELWRYALTEHSQYFRTAIEDSPNPDIPTRFNQDSFTLGAFGGQQLVGIVSVQRDVKIRLCHKALLFGMFVDPRFSTQGLGRALLNEAVKRVKSNAEIRQIYLTVLDSNIRAKNLYKSVGFELFAREPQSVKIDDEYVDECQMMLFV